VGKVAPVTNALPESVADPRASNLFIRHLGELWDSLSATVRVTAGTKAAVALANRQSTTIDGDFYTIHYLDEAVLADELCEYGAEAIVLTPVSLRDAVIQRLERLVADHA
jgi:proteasome accessory factor B